MKGRSVVLLSGLLVLSGCFNALPLDKPQEEFQAASTTASQAALKAEESAAACRSQAEENARMIDEARALSKRAAGASQRCDAVLARLLKPKPKVIIRRPKTPTAEPAKPEASAASSKSAGPEYAPSDAPL